MLIHTISKKSKISLTMEHETKHENNQRGGNEVVNLWRTWMSETPTKLEKMAAPPL